VRSASHVSAREASHVRGAVLLEQAISAIELNLNHPGAKIMDNVAQLVRIDLLHFHYGILNSSRFKIMAILNQEQYPSSIYLRCRYLSCP
jgi:hypothetical protein